jgi:hypothetical protein
VLCLICQGGNYFDWRHHFRRFDFYPQQTWNRCDTDAEVKKKILRFDRGSGANNRGFSIRSTSKVPSTIALEEIRGTNHLRPSSPRHSSDSRIDIIISIAFGLLEARPPGHRLMILAPFHLYEIHPAYQPLARLPRKNVYEILHRQVPRTAATITTTITTTTAYGYVTLRISYCSDQPLLNSLVFAEAQTLGSSCCRGCGCFWLWC